MMNEEQLQRIEKGFAVATPLSIYNPHSDRALVDIMVDLESRTIVPALIAEVRALRAKLDAVPVSAISYMMADITPVDDGDTQRLHQSRAAVLAWLDDEQDAANADAEMRAPTYNGGCW